MQKQVSAALSTSTFRICICSSSFIHFTSTELQIKKPSSDSQQINTAKLGGKLTSRLFFMCSKLVRLFHLLTF